MKIHSLLLATIATIALAAPARAAETDEGPIQVADASPKKKAFKTATVQQVRIGVHPDKTRLVLDMDGPAEFTHGNGGDGKSVTVDIKNVNWKAAPSGTGGKSGIEKYGFTKANGGGKLVINTKEAMKVQKAFLLSDDEGPGRKLVVDLVAVGAGAPAPAKTAPAQQAMAPAKAPDPAPAMAEQPAPTGLGGVMMAAQEPKQPEMAGKGGAASGPYVRADLAFAITHDPELKPNGAWPAARGTTSVSDNGNFVTGRAGIGYRFTPEFRADLTLGFQSESVEYASPGGVVVKGDTDIRSLVTMVNAYYDVGTWSGFTPYLGAGMGWAHHWTDDIRHTSAAGVAGTEKGEGTNTFAWSLGAGVSYAIDPQWSLDLGYRFNDLGRPDIGKGWTDSAGTAYGGTTLDSRLYSHELSAGLRYSF